MYELALSLGFGCVLRDLETFVLLLLRTFAAVSSAVYFAHGTKIHDGVDFTTAYCITSEGCSRSALFRRAAAVFFAALKDTTI